MLSNNSLDIIGNFNILAFSVLISSGVSLAKSNLYHMREVTHVGIIKIIVKEELGSC